MADSYVIEIQTPDGTWTEVTDLVDLESMGSYSYGIEDSLLQFRTGDITLSLQTDSQGTIAALFDTPDPSLTYRLRINRNGLKLFEGVIELPGQGRVSLNDASMEISAYGYLALLDKISAEAVKRSINPLSTGAGNEGDFPLTLAYGTDNLTADDKLRLASDSDSEEVEIKGITSSTVVGLKDALSMDWPATRLEFLTPYYRRRTITFLVQQLFAAAGISNPTIDLTGTDFQVPVGTPINTDGLPVLTQNPRGFISANGKLRARMSDFNEYETTSAQDPWTAVSSGNRIGGDGSGDSQFLVDWTKYLPTEPTTKTFKWNQYKNGTGASLDRAHGLGVDHLASPPRAYYLRMTNHAVKISYSDWNLATKDFGATLTDLVTLETAGGGALDNVGISCEYDSENGFVWYAYGKNDTNVGVFGYYNLSTATNVILDTLTLGGSDPNSEFGRLVYSRPARLLLRSTPFDADTDAVQAYQGGAFMFQQPIPKGLRMPTLRYVARRWVGIVLQRDKTYLFTADRLFQSYQLLEFSESAITDPFAGEDWDHANTPFGVLGDQLFAVINGQYVVVSNLYAGIVSYADFSGRTIAGALVELAKIVNCVVWVDNDYNGYFVSRNSQIFNAAETKAIDGLVITQDEDIVWDKWFGRVSITVGGVTISLGDVSLSQNELQVESDLVSNLSVQSGLAYAYKLFYSRARRARTVRIDDDETIYFPYQRVLMGAEEWCIYDTTYDWGQREITLQLVEADPITGDEAPSTVYGPNLIVSNSGYESWASGSVNNVGRPTDWRDVSDGPNQVIWDAANVITGNYSCRLIMTAGACGAVESRYEGGNLQFQLITGSTYLVRFKRKCLASTHPGRWTIWLYPSQSSTTVSFFLRRDMTVFEPNAGFPNTTWPLVQLTTTVAIFENLFTVQGTGVSGSYWASFVAMNHTQTDHDVIDDVEVRQVL